MVSSTSPLRTSYFRQFHMLFTKGATDSCGSLYPAIHAFSVLRMSSCRKVRSRVQLRMRGRSTPPTTYLDVNGDTLSLVQLLNQE